MERVPRSLDHLRLVSLRVVEVAEQSLPEMRRHEHHLKVIGSSLAALFEVGTCNRKCFGNAHILESLSGRTYNLGCSAFLLAERGFYDEAMNLVRSIGEIGNLVLLAAAEKGAIQKWIAADRRTRLHEFSPAKVRARLERAGFAEVMCANQDWYADLCERYTHVTPQTQPNLHNEIALPIVGGILQPDGLALVLGELANVLGAVALVACKFANLDDYGEELTTLAKSENP